MNLMGQNKMFVQAVNNKLYMDPIIEGPNYYIKSEEMEDFEIVLREGNVLTTLKSSRDMAMERFRELGMKVKVADAKTGEEDVFAFPPTWKGLHRGFKWMFQLKDKMPVPTSYRACVDYPTSDCKFMAWELVFDMAVVLAYLDRGIYDSILLSFLAGKELFPPLDKRVDKKLRKSLEQQLKSGVRDGDGHVTLFRIDL